MFTIYRKNSSGTFTKLGETRYLEDAKSILKNWAIGYIIGGSGETLIKKGM